jgi:hypothetical protein
MRLAGILLAGLALACLFTSNARAADEEVTLKGKLMCGKCELKQAKKCTNVLQVTRDGKKVNYWLVDKGNGEEYHEEVCGGGQKNAVVTGTVTVKDGKNRLKASKVEVVK